MELTLSTKSSLKCLKEWQIRGKEKKDLVDRIKKKLTMLKKRECMD